MVTGIYIGANKETVKEARYAILDIIKSSNSEAIVIKGLEILKEICSVNDTTIQHCNFTVNEEKEGKDGN